MINLDDLTLGQLKEIAAATRMRPADVPALPDAAHPLLNKNVFVRTVTHAHTGKLVAVTAHDLVLMDAAWIACTSRLADFIKDGKFTDAQGRNAEIEPFPSGAPVFVNRGAVVDMTEWTHQLPRDQK